MANKIEFTTEWISNIPKTINDNGCWIPLNHRSDSAGYVSIMFEGVSYVISRLSMCIYNNISYNNKKIVARHDIGCDRACFNYNHLKPGTVSDNAKDSVKEGTHWQTKKKCCPKCGSEYRTKIIKSGWSKGNKYRYCLACKALGDLGRKR